MFKTPLQLVPKTDSVPIRMNYVVIVDTTCTACGVEKHPSYVCRKFKSVSLQQRMNLLREHQLCINCLQFFHLHVASQCTSKHKSQERCKPHHMLLHSQFEHDGVANTVGQAAKESLQNEIDDSPAHHNSDLSFPILEVRRVVRQLSRVKSG